MNGTDGPAINSGHRAKDVVGKHAFHPLLFALYPVLLLYSDNVAEVQSTEVVGPALVVLALAGGVYLALAALIRGPRQAAILASTFILPLLLFGLIVDTANPRSSITRLGALHGVALASAVTVLMMSLGLFLASRARFVRPTTQALNVVSVLLIGLTLIPIVTFTLESRSALRVDTAAWPDVTVSRDTSRDIYHLVFDRYGSATALEAEHGIDNTEFLSALHDRGFQIVDRARPNHLKTMMSLASTMSMALLDDMAEKMGTTDSLEPIRGLILNSRAGSLLKGLGYRYIHVGSWYGGTRDSKTADSVRHLGRYQSFTSLLVDRSILSLGSLAWLIDDEALAARMFDRQAAATFDFQLTELEAIAGEIGPKYVFAHILLPHPPFVYLADGTFAPGEATYESQLHYLNMIILGHIDPLLAVAEDEWPIIILQADEGPYPARFSNDQENFDWTSATDAELLSKFGVLNAMFLPGSGGTKHLPEDLTLVNTYPEIFRRYFGATIQNLPDLSYASSARHPYELSDITERLTLAEARLARDSAQFEQP